MSDENGHRPPKRDQDTEEEGEGTTKRIKLGGISEDANAAANVNPTCGADDVSSDGEESSEAQESPKAVYTRDPGTKTYGEMRKCLRQLTDIVARTEQNDESLRRMRSTIEMLKKLVLSEHQDGEIPNARKLLQMNLKYVLFNSKDIKDVLNIKNFVSNLEDSSAAKSDEDDSVYMFLAKYATELWYHWNEDNEEWEWTPEADHWLWMPCSTNKVTDGKWKDEIPAPENVQIINYLNIVRPLPYDEQYLSSSYDIAHLLGQLKRLGDEQINEQVKIIAAAVVALEDIPASDNSIVKDTLTRFRELGD